MEPNVSSDSVLPCIPCFSLAENPPDALENGLDMRNESRKLCTFRPLVCYGEPVDVVLVISSFDFFVVGKDITKNHGLVNRGTRTHEKRYELDKTDAIYGVTKEASITSLG